MHRSLLLAGTILGMMVAPQLATAATEDQIVNAIDSGLAHLDATQNPVGYWNYGGYEQAVTGAAIGAFVSQESHWGANAAKYQADVNNAASWLLNSATVTTVGARGDGMNPCGVGTCTGIYWDGAGEATYTTGIVASAIGQLGASNPNAIATVTGPLAGMTYQQIGQGIINEFAYGQTNASNAQWSNAIGGWRYFPGTGDSDGSTTQWAVLSMIYGKSLGATIPQFVKDGLTQWLAFDQAADGSGCYQGAGSGICEQSDTGSLLIGLNMIGKPISDPQVQAALAFLNAHWSEGANGTWWGDFGQPYAMWADYKALELYLGLNDASFAVDPSECGALSAGISCNWWQTYNQWLVQSQSGDGSWPGYAYWTDPLSTAWDVSILGGTIIPPINAPEPSTWVMMLAGLTGLGLVAGRRRKERLAEAIG
jgi:hypothetical protein